MSRLELLQTVQERVDSELNRVYGRIMDHLAPEGASDSREHQQYKMEREALKTAQRAWIDFRDTNEKWVYQDWHPGSIKTIKVLNRRIAMTINRANE
ncbi:MAG: lysozyme inhibitor LprI family protein, partial [bacterium]